MLIMLFDRTYGVEIECVAPAGVDRSEIARLINAAGVDIRVESLNHTTRTWWKLTTDCSIMGRGSDRGMEIVSPPLSGEAGLTEIKKVADVLLSKGVTVNRSCGLHCHVDVRNLPHDAMVRLALDYARHERAIDRVMPPSRRGNANTYGTSIARRATEIAAARTGYNLALAMSRHSHRAKYVKLNFLPYTSRGTVEFRHHSGTVDGNKIAMWVQFCLRMIAKAKTSTAPLAINRYPTAPRAEGPRAGTKQAIIFGLLTRPEGVTRQELLAATGWPSVSMQQQAGWLGLTLRKERNWRGRSRWRYYGTPITGTATVTETPRQTPVTQTRPTLANLLTSLDVTADERTYWEARAAHFAVAEDDEPVAVPAAPTPILNLGDVDVRRELIQEVRTPAQLDADLPTFETENF